tara:strand:+ start:252 stop:743 length:492 start_codon:yes stop_codon:yes gene_type:complete
MTSQLELYQQVILEHNRKPKNFGKPKDWTHQAEGFNPLCGDHLWVYCEIDKKKDIISKVFFEGTGCAICKASASMMTASLTGLSRQKALELFENFHHLLQKKIDSTEKKEKLGKLMIFANIWKFPLRVKCASLAWHTFQGALEQRKNPVSTEKKEEEDSHAEI